MIFCIAVLKQVVPRFQRPATLALSRESKEQVTETDCEYNCCFCLYDMLYKYVTKALFSLHV